MLFQPMSFCLLNGFSPKLLNLWKIWSDGLMDQWKNENKKNVARSNKPFKIAIVGKAHVLLILWTIIYIGNHFLRRSFKHYSSFTDWCIYETFYTLTILLIIKGMHVISLNTAHSSFSGNHTTFSTCHCAVTQIKYGKWYKNSKKVLLNCL